MPTFVTAHTSARLEILGFSMSGAYISRDIFARFKTMRRKQNIASARGIQKQNCIFNFRDNKSLIKKNAIHCFFFLLLYRTTAAELSLKTSRYPQFTF